MQDFKDLKVWQKSHALTLAVYKATAAFPKGEIYGLTSQLRRASVSVPANIAEGCGRSGRAELSRFLTIAMGSATELQYYFMLCRDIDYLKPDLCDLLVAEVTEIKKMLSALLKRTRKND